MAAGVIYQTVTTTTGETVELAFYVDDTVSPTVWTPVSRLASDSPGVVAVGPNTKTNALPVTRATDDEPAHDAADSGIGTKITAKAETSIAGLTLVADGDRTDLFAGIDGVLITRPHCNLEDIVTVTPVEITDGSSTSIIASQGAGVKFYLTSVSISNTSATAVEVDLRDGAAGAVKWTFPVPANTSGVVYSFPVPLGFSAATAMCADPSAAASTITVSAVGFKSKV
jgi:hypothetical protein